MCVIDNAEEYIQLLLGEFADWYRQSFHNFVDHCCTDLIVRQRVYCWISIRQLIKRQFHRAPNPLPRDARHSMDDHRNGLVWNPVSREPG